MTEPTLKSLSKVNIKLTDEPIILTGPKETGKSTLTAIFSQLFAEYYDRKSS